MKFPDNPLLGPLSRADFIVENTKLIALVINRHFRAQLAATRTPRSDAVNDGVIGLINAYDRYSDASVPFGAFAFPHIYGEIANALARRPSTGVRVPGWLYPIIKRINRAGLADAVPEVIAQELAITAKQARQALRCIRIARTEALPDKDTRGLTDDHTRLATDAFIERLKPQQAQVVRLLMAYYSRTEVAEKLGVSRQYIGKVVRQARANYEVYEKLSA